MCEQCRDSEFQCRDSTMLSLLESCFGVATLELMLRLCMLLLNSNVATPSFDVVTLIFLF